MPSKVFMNPPWPKDCVVDYRLYMNRIIADWSVEEATYTKEGEVPKSKQHLFRAVDHMGGLFKNTKEMCDKWTISKSTYYRRRKVNKSLRYCLEGLV